MADVRHAAGHQRDQGARAITIAQLATHTAGFPKPGGYLELQEAVARRHDLVLLRRRVELAR